MSTTAVLTYFAGRGHGERVRIALAASRVAYRENLLTKRGDMDAVRSRCLLGQVPLLEMPDGTSYVQSWAIVRHLARVGGLVPADPALAARADACVEQCRDWTTAANFVGFGWPGSDGKDALEKMRTASLKHAAVFEGLLGAAPFLTGAAPCWADFQLLLCLDIIEDHHAGFVAAFPRLAALRKTLHAAPAMQAYYNGGGAYGVVDAAYIESVGAALSPAAAV